MFDFFKVPFNEDFSGIDPLKSNPEAVNELILVYRSFMEQVELNCEMTEDGIRNNDISLVHSSHQSHIRCIERLIVAIKSWKFRYNLPGDLYAKWLEELAQILDYTKKLGELG